MSRLNGGKLAPTPTHFVRLHSYRLTAISSTDTTETYDVPTDTTTQPPKC